MTEEARSLFFDAYNRSSLTEAQKILDDNPTIAGELINGHYHYNISVSGTPLHAACLYAIEKRVIMLLGNASLDVNLPAQGTGNTPLHGACVQGSMKVIRLMLADKRVNPNVRRVNDGVTPLGIAASQGHLDVVQYFISEVPNLDLGELGTMSSAIGRAQDIIAAHSDFTNSQKAEIVKLLEAYQADPVAVRRLVQPIPLLVPTLLPSESPKSFEK